MICIYGISNVHSTPFKNIDSQRLEGLRFIFMDINAISLEL